MKRQERTRAEFPIAGIGASAGGIEALTALLQPLSPDIGMAFVIVLHLSPHRESFLPGVLAAVTRLPVAHAEKDTKILPGHVYVVPAARFIELADGHLRLIQRPLDRSQYTPINHFFSSLAEFGEGRGVGVVLSGNASDGALGLRDIKAAGGITMAQDPSTARFDSMPRAAIAAGVDFVLPPALLAQELIHIASHPVVRSDGALQLSADKGREREHIEAIYGLLRKNGGIDYSEYKSPTVLRRLHRQMVVRRVPTLGQYVRLLEDDPAEVARLSESILIHVTRFFRDPAAFEALAPLIKGLIENRSAQEPIRVWVPGCSTGEEAYSVAITLLEQLEAAKSRVPIQVFGTDVSEVAISRARRGIFAGTIAGDLSAERLHRYFIQLDDSYSVVQGVRALCVFARQDVAQDPPFSRLDLVACRNLLIYLNGPLQQRILDVFAYSLRPAGLLMLGGAETTGERGPDAFESVDRKNRIYRKRAGGASRLPQIGTPLRTGERAERVDRAERGEAGDLRSEGHVNRQADRVLLESYTPPAVLIDQDLIIQQVRGKVDPFLALPSGNASLAIFKMARPGIAMGLRAAVERARQVQKPVRRDGIQVKIDRRVRGVTLHVLPMKAPNGAQHFLVLFELSEPGRATKTKGKAQDEPRGSAKQVKNLEHELEGTRRELQSMIQDLESANEELQSANEEILSSNEELQSTNEELDTAREELQSTNEEIITVNEELHGRNEDLSRVNGDLLNLLANVSIAIVMVDRDMRIRRFTPQAERVLNLLPSDIGRPLGHIKPNVDCPKLESLITESLSRTAEIDREIQDFEGRWYSLKIRPYQNVDNRIDGAVMMLLDIDTVKRQHHEAAIIDAIIDVSREAMIVVDQHFVVRQASASFYEGFGLEPGQALDHSVFEIGGDTHFENRDLRSALDAVLGKDVTLRDVPVTIRVQDGSVRATLANVRRLRVHDGSGDRILLVLNPTTR